VITLATAYSPVKKLTLALDVSMVGWSAFDTLGFDYETNTPELADTRSAREYKNTVSYRFGAQYGITAKLDARAGIKYLVTPVKDGYVTPEVPDASHINYSIGLGYKLSPRLAADMSFTYQTMERTGKNIETQLSGTYKSVLYIPGISINYNF
jgi:long-chain fatty acid transport protein